MTTPHLATQPTFAELFTPKLVTVFREGYRLRDLQADAIAGLTVAIVALPLSMAIAIAGGVPPAHGLYTAIVGGFFVSALGGSRFQIGGPAGAFIVLVAAIVQRHGVDGLLLATFLAGLIMIAVGFLRLGTYIKYIPYPVTVGFTAGIAVIIFASQIRELFGLDIEQEPAELLPKLAAIGEALPSLDTQTVAISLFSVAVILGVRKYRPGWPALLIAVASAAVLTAVLQLDVATIGSRFGDIPRLLPAPQLPDMSLAKIQAVLPDAIALAILGAIESLLSAVVADGMSGSRHRSNCELVAQGVANVAAASFSGVPVTGTIARTATNVRAGARGPVAGILHSAYLLAFMLVAAPLLLHVPLAALAAVLIVVAWNMAERHEFVTLVRASAGDRVVLLSTFLLTIFYDLTVAIGVGVVLGAVLFLRRMADSVLIDGQPGFILEDQPDSGAARAALKGSEDVLIYRIRGAFFFGATAKVTSVLDRMGKYPRIIILDFSEVPFIDSTAAKSIHGFARKVQEAGSSTLIVGTSRQVRRILLTAGLRKPLVRYARDARSGLALVDRGRQSEPLGLAEGPDGEALPQPVPG